MNLGVERRNFFRQIGEINKLRIKRKECKTYKKVTMDNGGRRMT